MADDFDLREARRSLASKDFAQAGELYGVLKRYPDTRDEASTALLIIALHSAIESGTRKDIDKVLYELQAYLGEHKDFPHGFIRVLAPIAIYYLPLPKPVTFILRYESDAPDYEASKAVAVLLRDIILPYALSQEISAISEAEKRLVLQGAIELDKFGGKFFLDSRGRYYKTVARSRFSENDLKMKELYAAMGYTDPRPVCNSEAEETIGTAIGIVVFLVGLLLLLFVSSLI